MLIRKLVLLFFALALASAPLAEARTRAPGRVSTFKSSRHSKRIKQKSGFKIRHGKIKH